MSLLTNAKSAATQPCIFFVTERKKEKKEKKKKKKKKKKKTFYLFVPNDGNKTFF
jgi:hypothetical protein